MRLPKMRAEQCCPARIYNDSLSFKLYAEDIKIVHCDSHNLQIWMSNKLLEFDDSATVEVEWSNVVNATDTTNLNL